MIHALAILLSFQLAGEFVTRTLGLPVPGPVLGLAGLLMALALIPRLEAVVQPTATVILAHLSLLFVPAGVGVVGHLTTLGEQALAVGAALVGSTILAIAAGALAFRAVARMTSAGDGGAE